MAMCNTQSQAGYLTISATLIVSAILVLIISQSVLHSLVSVESLTEIEQSLNARTRAHACAEIAWQQFMEDSSYTGEQEIELQGGTCSIARIDSENLHQVSVLVEAQEGSIVLRLRVQGDTESTTVATTVWELE